MPLAEGAEQVFIVKPGDHNAGIDGDSLNLTLMNDYPRFSLQFGSLSGDAVLKIFSGNADGVKTTAEKFRHRVTDAVQGAALSDQYPAWVAGVTSLTLTAATFQNRLLIVELESVTSDPNQEWATLELGSEAATLNVSILAVIDRRYKNSKGDPSIL